MKRGEPGFGASLKSHVRKWPFPVEFALVMAVAFGPFIYSAWRAMPHGKRAQVLFSDADMLRTVVLETVIALGLVVFLKMRGYTRADFPFNFHLGEWARGVWLIAAGYVSVMAATVLAVAFLGPESFTAGMMKVTLAVTFPVAVGASFVNALFEELFVTGYILRTLEKPHGIETAVLVSVFMRFLYHVYQGPQAIFSVIPMGLTFAAYFAHKRNLWPLVLAHALIDIASFSSSPR